ncbi:MAG: methyltransferase domain-containing protein, partial [Planctomycetota bacterium]|nr:methyltransferase domain-containing protein [Planctomycetota bacterium]
MATPDSRLISPRFPRSGKYNPDWVIANSFGGPVLWLTEWLTDSLDLRPGMRVLDLGCGRCVSSVYLAREFGVQVWGADLWVSANENLHRVREAGLGDQIFPLHCDARSLPFGGGFFDAIICVDAFSYFGTDSLYLNYLAHFVREGGQIAIAGAGLMKEFEQKVPEHLRQIWTQDFWCIRSADWWRRLWEPTGIVAIEVSDAMVDGGQVWVDWQSAAHPSNREELEAIRADAGRNLGYVRQIGRRQKNVELAAYCFPDTLRTMLPEQLISHPVLRTT